MTTHRIYVKSNTVQMHCDETIITALGHVNLEIISFHAICVAMSFIILILE